VCIASSLSVDGFILGDLLSTTAGLCSGISGGSAAGWSAGTAGGTSACPGGARAGSSSGAWNRFGRSPCSGNWSCCLSVSITVSVGTGQGALESQKFQVWKWADLLSADEHSNPSLLRGGVEIQISPMV